MRVLLDANVFLSYLLAPDAERTVATVVTACLTSDEIELLIPPELISEIARKVASKRYFQQRIPRAKIKELVAQLTALTGLLPPLEESGGFSRDPKGDYLVFYGVIYEADYLVTGDNDLLTFGSVGALRLVTPSSLLALLKRKLLPP